MKQFSQQLHKKATATVKLQAAEKRDLRERVVAYMEYHPLPAELRTKQAPIVIDNKAVSSSDPFTLIKVPFAQWFKYSAVAAVMVVLVVPFMAERAVPGDTLYSVKVQVNEELRSKLIFNSYQKVEWETERLNRRIAEARLLASEGRLTEAVELRMAEAVRTHTENANREIEVLRTEDADAADIASITFDTVLEMQATAFQTADSEVVDGSAAPRPTDLIASAINESRELSKGRASSTPSYVSLVARTEVNLTRIYELKEAVSKILTEEQKPELSRRIQDIERMFAEAVEEGVVDEPGTRQALVSVMQHSQKLIVFMAQLHLAQTVDIESLVPIVLTGDEEKLFMEETLRSLQEKMNTIASGVQSVEDEALLDKVIFAQGVLEESVGFMTAPEITYEAFTLYARDAQALADDAIALLEQKLPAQNEVPEVPLDVDEDQETSTTTEDIVEEVLDEVLATTTETILLE